MENGYGRRKKNKNKMKTLFPSCSEYVCRIKLTKKELEQAKKMAKKFNFSNEDLKLFEEHLEQGEDQPQNAFGEFIEEEFAQPYTFIRETILEQRNNDTISNSDREK